MDVFSEPGLVAHCQDLKCSQFCAYTLPSWGHGGSCIDVDGEQLCSHLGSATESQFPQVDCVDRQAYLAKLW